jgi:hypothetical protein
MRSIQLLNLLVLLSISHFDFLPNVHLQYILISNRDHLNDSKSERVILSPALQYHIRVSWKYLLAIYIFLSHSAWASFGNPE